MFDKQDLTIKVSLAEDEMYAYEEGSILAKEFSKGILKYIEKDKRILFESRKYEFGSDLMDIKQIRMIDNDALLLKRYAVEITAYIAEHYKGKVSRSILRRGLWQYWGNKDDVMNFVMKTNQALESARERANKMSRLYDRILSQAKSYGKLCIKQFAEENFELLNNSISGGINSKGARFIVKSVIENLISKGDLTGIIDPDSMEYLDRDLVERKQKIISINFQMDFNDILQKLGSKGILLTAIQCPQCGANNSIPGSGSEFNCEYCQAGIKVTDIFEKFKGILQ